MSVELDLSSLPSSSQLDVHIHIAAPLRVTASEARRRVTRLIASEIGNLLYGGEPTLMIGERILWRVPVLLAYPESGPVGQAGTLDVDVETGSVLANQEQLTAIADYALFLAERSAAVLSDAPQRSKRVFGSARGQLQIMPDFDEPLPEFQKYQ